MKISKFLGGVALLFSVTILSSCIGSPNPGHMKEVDALVPVYMQFDPSSHSNVVSSAPREFENLGDIVSYGAYLFIIEIREGIHVLDNSDPENPMNMHFIEVPGVTEITIDDDVLFCNYGHQLILIDISDLSDVVVVEAIDDFYDETSTPLFPDNYRGSFVCVDPARGLVVGWTMERIYYPKCWT